MCFVGNYIFHFSLQMVFYLIHFLNDFLLSLLVATVVSINRSCFINVLFSNGFTLFFDNSWFLFIISLHLDICSDYEFTSWPFSLNSLWKKRIWFSKWLINHSEWLSSVFVILDCNSLFLNIITSFKKDFLEIQIHQ